MLVRSLVARSAAGTPPLLALAMLAAGCGADPSSLETVDEGTASAGEAVTAVPLWTAHYGYVAGGWRVDKNPRLVADVNGDGFPDVVGFYNDGTYVSLSTGAGLGDPARWLTAYGYDSGAGNWHMDRDLRFVADVNADGLADVVGFGDDGVYVSLSTGTAFAPPEVWLSHRFGYQPAAGDWNPTRTLRYLADVNGDRLPDIVGFGSTGVSVSLGTGTSFAAPATWLANQFGYGVGSGQWRNDQHPRYLADVNGDGLADIVGFYKDGPHVALSTGTAFGTPSLWLLNFYGSDRVAGSWSIDRNPRYLADVDGDGRADIVGIGNGPVLVSRSTGTAFATPAGWIALPNGAGGGVPGGGGLGGLGGLGGGSGGYGSPTSAALRMLLDLDGDGRADLLGFDGDGPDLYRSTGAAFAKASLLVSNFGPNQGWRPDRHIRLVADMNNDGRPDVVGFYDDGVHVWTH